MCFQLCITTTLDERSLERSLSLTRLSIKVNFLRSLDADDLINDFSKIKVKIKSFCSHQYWYILLLIVFYHRLFNNYFNELIFLIRNCNFIVIPLKEKNKNKKLNIFITNINGPL